MKKAKSLYFSTIFILSIFYASDGIIFSQEILTKEQSNVSLEPVPFLPGIVSVPRTFGTTFLPDAKTVYFARFNPESKKSTIMKSTFRDGIWTSAVTAEFSGNYPDGDPFISPDGLKIFFWSTRPKDGSEMPSKSSNIWVAYKTPTCFGNPVFLGSKLKIPAGGAPAVSNNGTLYFFTSQGDSTNRTDIYKSIPDNGEYSGKINLGKPVNTKYSELDAFISPDESYIIFSSDRPGTIGKLDLYISWNSEGKWSEPVNLGDKINSPADEYCPSVSHDGKYFYFTSSRESEPTGPVYRVDFNLLLNSLNQSKKEEN
jgi:hypothetical protein